MKTKKISKFIFTCLLLIGISGLSNALSFDTGAGVAGDYKVEWLNPLYHKDSYEAGSTIPVKFKLLDSDGNFVVDYATSIDIVGPTTQHFETGEGDDNIRINADEECYIANFHSNTEITDEYEIIIKVGGNEPENSRINFKLR